MIVSFKMKLLAKYEKPGRKVDQAKRLRINVTWDNFFFAVKLCLELRTRGK